jgi:hypothetical protein
MRKEKLVWWKRWLLKVIDFIEFIVEYIKKDNELRKIRVARAVAKAKKEDRERKEAPPKKEKRQVVMISPRATKSFLLGFIIGFLSICGIGVIVLAIVWWF